MPVLRVIILWHQHQPFYKDLVSGEYRLPWVRLHALKDYFGMVKLLDEFPNVHQTFNLVPSLITQIQDYVSGTAQDPFLQVAAKPAKDLTPEERRFALQYLFQANPVHMIGRYPRYRELWERFRGSGSSPEPAEKYFQAQDFTDLQVLSQIAWFDEFFLQDPEVAALIQKGRNYSLDDQRFVILHQRELLAKVLPAHAEAAQRGFIEISTSPFYHPILPLICDTKVFRVRPQGVWPSEGSVSEEVLAIAQSLGVKWMATDEEVLGRTLGVSFSREGDGRLPAEPAAKLYNIHRYQSGQTEMNMIFRDHTISDLIGFVYSGMPPQEAATHLMRSIKQSAQPALDQGKDAVLSIILDGENAWEYYPQSGREFLRRFYDALQREPGVEAVTVSEAIQRHKDFGQLSSLVPGSWIHANFNVWIGAPEDNRAWDYLQHARNFYDQTSAGATEPQRKLAFEEILISEGSDWNWWYGPEHHSANDRDFDELYRKHLSNVYQALGARPPDYLAQPIMAGMARPAFLHQSAYIHPRITGDMVRYFEWMGAAVYTADHRSGSMHGKQFLLDSVYAGIDERNVYGRLDFADGKVPDIDFELVVNLESWVADSPENDGSRHRRALRLDVTVQKGQIHDWKVTADENQLLATSQESSSVATLALGKNFEFKLPLDWLQAENATKLRLRFSLWRQGLPVDALPLEGWIELQLVSEEELAAMA
ncbi:MAG: glycoside hydrolase [Acidobacteria bacterium]|nr:MAG: glycoside hydrolase [Acidobacteriota bacterium]